ncbi:NAD(P)-dependent oxidoreductase [Brachybacterium sp. ACRRE]|uniref:NAD(P)-dependent oxidoreductase n=1 Tax=Brachybacterium sp. ACRRE TaxID=2918184 RepID=UPI002102CB5A|nr:NAD(P)-dependent oxidoreductase [Brachybacterium sp. ACRRE]
MSTDDDVRPDPARPVAPAHGAENAKHSKNAEDSAVEPSTARGPGSPRVGVLGLGSMGLPMAEHLLRAHGSLTVHSRTPKPQLTEQGARWAQTPRELAEAVDAILVMLPDLPDLEPLLGGEDGLLASAGELLLMIGSTCSSVQVRELGERLAAESGGRVRVVDCPVSGGEDGAQAGTLAIMLGGTEDDAAEAARLLAPCGNPVRLGPLGAGEVAKSCNQMIVSATALALGEVTVLAERSGLDLGTLFELLQGGYAGSNLMASRREKFVTGDDSPSGVAKYMVKDLRFAGEIAEATGTHGALLPALRAAFDELVEAGLGDRDLATTRRFTEQRG